MKNQHETSLRIRLASLAIIGLFIALGAAAYLSGRQVKRDSELVAKDAVPGTIAAHKMRMAMSRGIGWVMVAASAQTAQSRDDSLKIVHDADGAFTNAVRQYEETIIINPAEDQALLGEVTNRYAKYHEQRMAYEALILAGDRDGSAAFLESNLVPAYVLVIGSAEKLLDYNHANSITYADHIRNSVHRLYWAVAVVMVLAVICAAVLIMNLSIRRREVRELRESEARFRMLIENAPTAISISREGKTMYVNQKWLLLFRQKNAEDATGQSIINQLAPESREMVMDRAQRRARGEPVPSDYEVVGLRSDGARFPMHVAVTSVELSDGKASLAFLTDMTERRRAQDELVWKTALLEAQVDSTLEGVLVVDTTGKKILQNRRFLELFKVPEEIAHDGDDAKMLQHAVNQMKNPQQFRERVIHLYGHPEEIGRDEIELADGRIFDRYSAPVRDKAGELFGRIWTFRDITEERRVQAEIRATNERYFRQEEALMGLTRDYALRRGSITELKRKVTEIAAETLDVERVSIWRYERDQQGIVCQDLFERSTRTHSGGKALRAKDYPAYFRAMAEGDIIVAHDAYRDPRTAEFSETYLRPHGISSMLDAPIHVIGSLTGVICSEHVGTARQWTADEQTFAIAIANVVSLLLAEEERQQIEGHLRQAQKMEGIGQLAGGVAHDFNNILAVIQMQSDLLKGSGELSARQMEFAGEIGTTVERAAALTRQLLLFSRREVFQPRDLDLSASIINTTKMLQRILGGSIEMQLKLASQPMFIHADPGMIDQVLLNLVVNARDAMPEGGRLVIETSGVELDEFVAAQTDQARVGTFVCLSVSDTGCGIPPEILPKIFEPFFTTKDVGKGTGLGLATVFGIVQQHQGWVNVYSEPGHGTVFKTYLPRLAGMTGKALAQKMQTGTRTGNETILLVEDDPSLRAAVRQALSQLGYRILEAPTGVKALEVWKQNRGEIRLLLTDMVMPDGMTGKELGRRILQDDPKLKVIYMSGFSTEVVGKDFPLEEGVNFLAKPFQASKLAQIIRDSLDGGR